MNIGVVGLGSMGKRRIRLLKSINKNLNIIGIDSRKDRREEASRLFGITVSNDLDEAITKYWLEVIVVSTSPLSHCKLVNAALKRKCHVFTELNLVDDMYEENIEAANSNNVILFLSSTMMYRKETEYIKNEVKKSNLPVNYNYHIGQYLPTWHSWESYKDFFVANKRSNGCREVFAIELPWLLDAFGEIEEISVLKGTMTDLDIDYCDNYIVTLKHSGGNKGSLHVNVASQYAVRNLEIYGQNCYMQWGGSPDSLKKYDTKEAKLKGISLYESVEKINLQNQSIIEDAYRDELIEFFSSIKGYAVPRYSFEKDQEILDIIDIIEGEL